MNNKSGSIKGLIVRFALVLVTASAAMSASGIPVAAACGPVTPVGYVGALNMVRAGAGMANAMSRDNPNGNTGMYTAVAVSGCNP